MDRHQSEAESGEKPETIKANTDIYEVFNALNSSAKQKNNMKDFKVFLDNSEDIKNNVSAIDYSYDIKIPIFTRDTGDKIIKSDLSEMMSLSMGIDDSNPMSSISSMSMGGMEMWEEMLPGDTNDSVNEILFNQYDLIYGSWPTSFDEVVLVATRNNQLPDVVMYSMGLKDSENLPELFKKVMTGETVDDYGQTEWSYEDICNKEF